MKYYNINSSFKQISTIRNEKFNNGHFVYIHVCKNNKLVFAISKIQIILKCLKKNLYLMINTNINKNTYNDSTNNQSENII